MPIDDYKNTTEPDNQQDPVAVILVKGIDYAISLKRWSKDSLKRYNRWFDGMRNMYEAEIRRFHIMFLDEIAKIQEQNLNKTSPIFSFDPKTGSFKYNNVSDTLSPKSREFSFLKALYTSPTHQADYKELMGGQENISKDDKITLTETIKVLKRKLGILPKTKNSNLDIIKNVSKYGYKLEI